MSYLGDTLTVGLILVLLFGSVALYLYTRVQQTEQKVNLLESIVLDLKLTGELSPFPEASSHQTPLTPTLIPTLTPTLTPIKTLSPIASPISSPIVSEYKAFEEEESEPLSSEEVQDVDIVNANVNVNESENIVSYDSMTLKELQSLVRSRGLTAERGAKKHQLIELVKRADVSAEVKPGSMSSSLSLEPFSNDEE